MTYNAGSSTSVTAYSCSSGPHDKCLEHAWHELAHVQEEVDSCSLSRARGCVWTHPVSEKCFPSATAFSLTQPAGS